MPIGSHGKSLYSWWTFIFMLKATTRTNIATGHLCNIIRIRNILSQREANNVVHAFVTSTPDYCNSLLSVCPKYPKYYSAIVTGTRKRVYISTTLTLLHRWDPAESRSLCIKLWKIELHGNMQVSPVNITSLSECSLPSDDALLVLCVFISHSRSNTTAHLLLLLLFLWVGL